MRKKDIVSCSINVFCSPEGKSRFVVKDGKMMDKICRRVSFEQRNGDGWISCFTLRQEQNIGDGEVLNDIFVRVGDDGEVNIVHLSDNYSDVVEKGVKMSEDQFLYESKEVKEVDIRETAFAFLNQLMSLQNDKFEKRPELIKEKTKDKE